MEERTEGTRGDKVEEWTEGDRVEAVWTEEKTVEGEKVDGVEEWMGGGRGTEWGYGRRSRRWRSGWGE